MNILLLKCYLCCPFSLDDNKYIIIYSVALFYFFLFFLVGAVLQ